MTKKGLVKRLRAVDHTSVEDCFLQSPLYAEAADRIQMLEIKNKRQRERCKIFRQAAMNSGMARIGAKVSLKKAVEALRVIARHRTTNEMELEPEYDTKEDQIEHKYNACIYWARARLAEIDGDKP